MKIALVLFALLLAGCACLHPPPEKDVWGPCAKYDLNQDGAIGMPDYSLLMKRKPPLTEMEWSAFRHYFGKRCPIAT